MVVHGGAARGGSAHGLVTFAVGGQDVEADRFLLTARSAYFEAMLRCGRHSLRV